MTNTTDKTEIENKKREKIEKCGILILTVSQYLDAETIKSTNTAYRKKLNRLYLEQKREEEAVEKFRQEYRAKREKRKRLHK